MLVYPSGVEVSSSALRFLPTKLRQYRRELGSRWRRLTPGRQALLTLAHLRNGHPYAQLAAGFGVGTTTAYRYVAEAVDLLAALAPTLKEAARTASMKAFRAAGRHPAAHRPDRRRPPLLLRETQKTRDERAAPRRPVRPAAPGITGSSRCRPRHPGRPYPASDQLRPMMERTQ